MTAEQFVDLEREWSQAELREYLLDNGWTPESLEGQVIPQGVKFIDFSPPTPADIARAEQLMTEHPEWEKLCRPK